MTNTRTIDKPPLLQLIDFNLDDIISELDCHKPKLSRIFRYSESRYDYAISLNALLQVLNGANIPKNSVIDMFKICDKLTHPDISNYNYSNELPILKIVFRMMLQRNCSHFSKGSFQHYHLFNLK